MNIRASQLRILQKFKLLSGAVGVVEDFKPVRDGRAPMVLLMTSRGLVRKRLHPDVTVWIENKEK